MTSHPPTRLPAAAGWLLATALAATACAGSRASASTTTAEPRPEPPPEAVLVPLPARSRCPLHDQGYDGTVDGLIGQSKRTIRRCFGVPRHRDGAWVYMERRGGCYHMRHGLALTFESGVVVAARRKIDVTGRICMDEDGNVY